MRYINESDDHMLVSGREGGREGGRGEGGG